MIKKDFSSGRTQNYLKTILSIIVLSLFFIPSYSQCTAIIGANIDPLEGCEVLTIQFSDLSPNVLSRSWNFGDGTAASVAQNPMHSFNAGVKGDTTYTVKLTVTCPSGSNISTKTVTVYAKPKVDFLANKASVCAITDSICLTNNSSYNIQNTYLWNFGDGTISSAFEPCKTYSTPGTYMTTLTVTSAHGCLDNKIKTNFIKVEPVPSTAFTVSGFSGCSPYTIVFDNITDISGETYSNWTWDYGDGSSKVLAFDSPPHTFTKPGKYTVTLKATNSLGCYNYSTQNITVNASPVAKFSVTTPVCQNSNALIQFTGTNISSPVYNWSFDSPSVISGSGPGPYQVKWNEPGNKIIKLTMDEGGCTSSYSEKIQVTPITKVFLQISSDYDTICSGQSVTFTVTPVNFVTYSFYINSNLVQKSSENVYVGSGFSANDKIFAKISDINGCTEIISDTISLFIKPSPAITLTSSEADDIICKNNNVTFTASPGGYNEYSFFVNNLPVQTGSTNTYNTSLLSDQDRVYAIATHKLCKSNTSNANSITVKEALPAPQVYCGISTTSSIQFSWDQVPGAIKYEVSINNGAWQQPSTGVLGLSHLLTGISAGEKDSIRVRAWDDAICGIGEVSSQVVCSAIGCPAVLFNLVDEERGACENEYIQLSIKDINIPNYSIEWNGKPPTTSLTYSYQAKTAGKVTVKVKNLDEPLCPTIEKKFNITVSPKIPVHITWTSSGDTICAGTPVKFTITPANLQNYEFYDNGLLLKSGQENTFTSTSIANGHKIYAQVKNGGCLLSSDTISFNNVVQPLKIPQVNFESATDHSVTFVWEPVPGARGYIVSVNDGSFIYPSTGMMGLHHTVFGLNPDDAVLLSVRAIGKSPCGNSEVSQPAIGFAESCIPPVFFIETSKQICKGDSVELTITNLNIPNYLVSWGELPPTKLKKLWITPVNDTIITVAVKNLDQPLCPRIVKYVEVIAGERPLPLILTSSDTDNEICQGEFIKFTTSPGGYDTYKFYSNSLLLNESSYNTFEGYGNQSFSNITARAVHNGCVGELSNRINTNVIPQLKTPQVNFGTTTNNKITFVWDSIPKATGYEISINNGPFTSPSSGPAGLTHEITGLIPGDSATISVRALGNPVCSNSAQSVPKTGHTGNCIAISYSMIPYSSICENTTLQLNISNINIANYSISWNNGTYANVASMSLIGKKDTLINVRIRNNDQLTCPVTEKYFEITVKKAAVISLTTDAIKDTVCFGGVVNFTATGGFERYVFIDKTNTLLDSPVNTYKSTVFSDDNDIYVRGYKNGCLSETPKIHTTILRVPDLTLISSKTGKICENDSVKFTCTPGFSRYVFSNTKSDLAETTQNVITLAVSDSVITVTGYNARNCASVAKNTVKFQIYSLPKVSISCTVDSICVSDYAAYYVLPSNLTGYDFYKNSVLKQSSGSNYYSTDSLRKGESISVVGYDFNGCRSLPSSSVFPYLKPYPDTKIGASSDGVCINDSVKLFMNKDLTFFPVNYYWNTGALTDSIKVAPKTATRYSLYYSSKICKNKVIDSKKILVDLDKVSNAYAGEDVTICINDSVQLIASGGINYQWNDSITLDSVGIYNPYAKPLITTTYIVTVSNAFCKNIDSVKVIIDLCLENLTDPVPQIISPNEDGINDYWVIYNIDYFTSNSVEIFNRWGNRVFYSTPYDNTWNGKSDRGVDLPDGTYFYVINLGNGSKPQTGYIIIHR